MDMYKFVRRVILVGLSYAVFISGLFGHAILLSAIPAVKQVVSGPDVPIRLRFNSRIDAKRSRIVLVGADGRQTVLTIEKQVSPNTLSADSKGMTRGFYILHWQVLATDGHLTRGIVPFQVQ